jgi:phosphatidate cytidylyltransferase
MRRILTAATLGGLVLLVVKLAPMWVCVAMLMAGIGLGVLEAYRMLGRAGSRPFGVLGVAVAVALAWSFGGLAPKVPPEVPLAALIVATSIAAMWLRPDPESMYETAVSTVMPVVVFALPLSFMIALRALPGPDGEDLLLLLIVAATFGDTAAYYVGSTFGKHRMAPALSPKKSWEGAIGGLAGAVLGAILASLWFYQSLAPVHAVVLGVVLGALGILGDLSESMIKRALGAKDASRLLPGHGGFLDRLDSLMFGAPVLYGYWTLFLGWPR